MTTLDGALQRRLIIGLGLTGAAIAFALIPTSDLRQKPPKPLFFYLTPLYRIKASSLHNLSTLKTIGHGCRLQGCTDMARIRPIEAILGCTCIYS